MIINSVSVRNSYRVLKNFGNVSKNAKVKLKFSNAGFMNNKFNRFNPAFDIVSFKGTEEKNDNLSLEIAQELPKGVEISDVIKKSIADENIIGKGANSTVYRMEDLDDYVLKVLNKDDPNKIDISEFPSDINLGQPVWQNKENPRIMILKKINGSEHSISNWSDTIWNDKEYKAYNVTKEQAELFSKQIKNLASMPQNSFDSLAKKIKYLDDKDYKIDSINPNNLIVDKEKNEINVIDYYKINPKEKTIQQNTYLDIIALMLDFTLFPEYFDKLDDNEKQNAVESIKTITKKAKQGAINAGLSLDDKKFRTYVCHVAKWFPNRSVPKNNSNEIYFRYYDVRMVDFLEMLENPDKWADRR